MNEIRDLLEALKQRDELVKTLQQSVVLQRRELENLTARVSATEDHYMQLVKILQKSIVKIDEPALGVN